MRVAFILAGALSLGLALSACSQSQGPGSPGGPSSKTADRALAKPQGAMAPKAESAAGDAAATVAAISIPQMAYVYTYSIAVPPAGVRDLLSTHQAACVAAGPANCQITGSNVAEDGRDELRATLSFRATPAWMTGFRAGLDQQAEKAGGRVRQANTSSEDLSRQIVDTEAALKAKATLRDRLQTLLATRPGGLSDLMELERRLAEVQGEIDATNSELAMMKSRVAMSDITLTYESVGVVAPAGVLAPIGDAVSDVAGILVGTLAFLIRFVALLAPWALIVALVVWLFRKRIRASRYGKAAPAAEG